MIQLRPPGPARPELIELLAACHERMRHFLGVAKSVASASPGAAPNEVADAAAAVHRYFTVAFPLHGVDEEESLIPRLQGRDPALDQTLDLIEQEHDALDTAIARLTSACARIAADPAGLDAIRTELANAASAAETLLRPHLAAEEATFFPAIERWIVPAKSEEVLAEIRGRRSRS